MCVGWAQVIFGVMYCTAAVMTEQAVEAGVCHQLISFGSTSLDASSLRGLA